MSIVSYNVSSPWSLASPAIQDERYEPVVPVAMDVGLGDIARSKGYVLDIDHPALHAALTAANLSDEDAGVCPVIIKAANRCGIDAAFYEGDAAGPRRIELYTQKGTGAIYANVVTHEASHLADNIAGDKVVSDIAKRVRKTVVSVGSVGIAAGLYYKLGVVSEIPWFTRAGMGALVIDVSLSAALGVEYVTRKEERRAFKAEGKEGSSVYKVMDGDQDVTIYPGLVRRFKDFTNQVFVPRFDL